ncbi:MAG: hypothetical protein MUC95_02745 [Spirochaetes bacterium]|nr:hypothetical protein [Spirochaetota bacterium]
MKSIEKTKENIGVSELDERTRKDLFNKFIEAGGRVIEDSKKKPLAEFDREKQLKYLRQIEKHRKSKSEKTIKQKKVEEAARVQAAMLYRGIMEDHGRFLLFIERHLVNLRLFFMSVLEFNGFFLKIKFLRDFENIYKNSLNEAQVLFIDIFQRDPKTASKIISHLDRIDPVYFELCRLTADAFNRTAVVKLLEHYMNFPNIPQHSLDIREPVINILKKLIPLYQYREHIEFAFEKAISIQMQYTDDWSINYSSRIKSIKDNVYIIFNKLYPRLYWLLCHYEGKIISPEMIDNIVAVSPEDRPGRREKDKKNIVFEMPYIEKDDIKEGGEEPVEEHPQENVNNPVMLGLNIIKKLDYKKIRAEYDKNGLFKNAGNNDKILIIYLLFLEFDREYSFILTTNKIKFNIVTSGAGKKDCKTDLITIYTYISKCYDRFREYAETMDTHKKLSGEKPLSSAHYIEYANRLSALEKDLIHASNEVRIHAKLFLERLIAELKYIIEDMVAGQNIISNQNEELIFERGIEGDKKLNGKKISEAFAAAFNFISGFLYRLGPDGDLAHGIEFKEDEKSDLSAVRPAKEKPADMEAKEAAHLKSITDELEDFL